MSLSAAEPSSRPRRRIGIDAACWSNDRGYGRFAREISRALVELAPEHEFLAVGDAATLADAPVVAANLLGVPVELGASPARAAAAAGYRTARDLLRLSRAVWRLRPDVFFFPSVYSYFPMPPGQRALVTVHDAIAERHPELIFPARRDRLFWDLKLRLALRQSPLVLTVSRHAAAEIERFRRVAPHRLRVALEAPAAAFRPPAPAEIAAARDRVGVPPRAPYFTYVGGLGPHKRVDVILRAHARLCDEPGRDVHLVLVGPHASDVFLSRVDELRSLAVELGAGIRLHWPGFLADDDLRGLYGGAVATLLPSESEGFGLPAVEAAACGTPVVATRESPLPELLAGGGLFVAPGCVDELVAAMRRLLDDDAGREALGRVARERAARLSWREGARAVLAALAEAAR